MMRKFLIALQFLTILPVHIRGPLTEREFASSAALFPLAGAVQAIMAALLAFLFSLVFSAEITAGLTVLVLTVLIGGFHLDGLADTFDALAVKSTGRQKADVERRLAVMKDSATGAIGVTALVLALLLKYLLLAELLSRFPLAAFLTLLIFMAVFSKWAVTLAMYHGKAARDEGLGRIFLSGKTVYNLVFSTISTAIVYLPVLFFGPKGLAGLTGAFFFIFVTAILYIFTLGAIRLCTNKFGGLTGDNFGAINEISEIIFLLAGILWLQHFI